MLPARAQLVVCFAHVAYRLQERFALRESGIASFEVRDAEALAARLPQADVLVVSGLWRNTLLDQAPRLRLIQSISAGTDQYSRAALAAHGVRLASARPGSECPRGCRARDGADPGTRPPSAGGA